MKIIAISDTHNKHKKLTIPKCDVLIHAGDFTWDGKFSDVRKFIHWFASQPAEYKVLIAGNHELTLDDTYPKFNPKIKDLILNDPDIIYLENSETIIEGLKIWGTPWTPAYYNWAFNGITDENAPFERGIPLSRIYERIPEDVNILICHGPAYDILDRTLHGDSRQGSVEMRKVTTKLDHLRLYICGHIHESRGMEIADGGVYYCNVASMDRDYEKLMDPVIIDIDENGFVQNVQGY